MFLHSDFASTPSVVGSGLVQSRWHYCPRHLTCQRKCPLEGEHNTKFLTLWPLLSLTLIHSHLRQRRWKKRNKICLWRNVHFGHFSSPFSKERSDWRADALRESGHIEKRSNNHTAYLSSTNVKQKIQCRTDIEFYVCSPLLHWRMQIPFLPRYWLIKRRQRGMVAMRLINLHSGQRQEKWQSHPSKVNSTRSFKSIKQTWLTSCCWLHI